MYRLQIISFLKSVSVAGLDTAECYDVRCGEWRIISPMSTRRSSVGVGVVNGTSGDRALCKSWRGEWYNGCCGDRALLTKPWTS